MNKLLYTARWMALTVMLPLLALVSARAQTVVYLSDTTSLSVVEVPGHTYTWELYDNGTVDFAIVPGNCPATSADFVGGNSGPTINVKWLKTGTYFFKVTALDATGCTMNLKIGIVEVRKEIPTATITPPDPICIGETASLKITLTGTGPWEITYTDGTNSHTLSAIAASPVMVSVRPKTTTSYWITEVKDVRATNSQPSPSVSLQVKPKPVSSKIYLYQP